MADESDSDKESRTEEGSDRRLQRAYDEGQVPIARDIVQVSALACGGVTLVAIAGGLRDSMIRLTADVANTLATQPFGMFRTRLTTPAMYLLFVMLAAATAAIVATFVQTRGGIWGNLAMPDPSRLFNLSKLTRIFSREFLTDMGMSLIKLAAVSYVMWSALSASFMTIGKLLLVPTEAQISGIFTPLAGAGIRVVTLLTIIAGIDFAVQRFRFREKMKMTKEELKREHKEDEGDPQMRGRRRRKQREMSKGRASFEVPRADALLVNPTHIAIAIRYRKKDGKAPRITAKGKGVLAEHMRDLAREHGIPIYQDIPLARMLFKRVKVGREIPADAYRAVAAILAFVYRITGRMPGAPRPSDDVGNNHSDVLGAR